MTLIRDLDEKCSVCGKSSPQPILASTNTSGYPDLDLRPSEMQRSTMGTWIHECPHCGYAAEDLEEDHNVSMDFLKSDGYIACDGYDFKSDLSKLFYRRYLIAEHENDVMMCFVSLRNCAWKCDDYKDENAVAIRKQAIRYLDVMIRTYEEERNSLLVTKSDFLRRSGEFEKLISEYEGLTLGDELLDNIIQFQIERACEGDASCYTVGDVLERQSHGL